MSSTKLRSKLILDEYIPYRLAVASNAASTLISSLYASKYGLKIAEWRLIVLLHEDGPSTQQALVRRGGMDKVTVSRAAQILSKRRLVKRTPHEHDGRSHHLVLTADGENLFNDVEPAAMTCEGLVIAEFSSEEIQQFKDFLRRIELAAQKELMP